MILRKIQISELQKLYGCCEKTASSIKKDIAEYNKLISGRVTLYHVARYENIDINELVNAIKNGKIL